MGDRVLVCNHREGPDWIPATVIEVLGPVTYTVETEQGYKWKRHADQMKDWLNSVPHFTQAPSETVSDELEMAETEGDPPTAVEPPKNSSAGETSEAAVTPESPVEETTPPSTEEPSAILPPTSSSRYPARNRQPPS